MVEWLALAAEVFRHVPMPSAEVAVPTLAAVGAGVVGRATKRTDSGGLIDRSADVVLDRQRLALEYQRLAAQERATVLEDARERYRLSIEERKAERAAALEEIRLRLEADRAAAQQRDEARRIDLEFARLATHAEDLRARHDNEQLRVMAENGLLKNVHPIRPGMQWYEDAKKRASER